MINDISIQKTKRVKPSVTNWSQYRIAWDRDIVAGLYRIERSLHFPNRRQPSLVGFLGNFRKIVWLALLACLWGTSPLLTKIGVADIPPITFAWGRAAFGASILYLILRWRGQPLPRWGAIWKHIAAVALIHNATPYIVIAWGVRYIDTGLLSILNGTTPLFTIVLAHFLVVEDRLTPAKLIGVVVGFGGLLVLIAPALSGAQATGRGIMAGLMAALCYAIAIIYARKQLRGLPPLAAPTAQLIVATIYLLPLSLIIDRPFSLTIPSWPAIGAWLGIGILGTAMGFIVYYRLVEIATPTYVSMVSYLIPIVGVSLGIIVLGEYLTWNVYTGFVIIATGVMIVNGRLKSRFYRGFKLSWIKTTLNG